MATTRPEKRLRKKRKPPKQFRLSYSFMLLFAMTIVGAITGLIAFNFGKQALEGVNPSPSGIKLPKVSPMAKPKASPPNQDGKTSFFLDELEIIADMKSRSQQELGGLTRPIAVASTNISDRKTIYSRVDRAYNSMRDPLAISASADERISERIIALRQKIYTRSRSYETSTNFDQPIATIATKASTNLPLLSTPVKLVPFRSRWADRETALPNSKKFMVEDVEVLPKTTSSFFIPDQQTSTTVVDINRP